MAQQVLHGGELHGEAQVHDLDGVARAGGVVHAVSGREQPERGPLGHVQPRDAVLLARAQGTALGKHLVKGHLVCDAADDCDGGAVWQQAESVCGERVAHARGRDHHVRGGKRAFERGDRKAGEARLERADGVRLRHGHARAQRSHAPREALADGAKAHHGDACPAGGGEERRSHEGHRRGGAGLSRAVAVVEAGLQAGVVDRHDGKRQLAFLLHGRERADAGGGFLRDAHEPRRQGRALHHHEAREVRAVVDDDVGPYAVHEAERPLALLRGRPRGVRLYGVAPGADLVGDGLVAFVRVAVHAHGGTGRGKALHEDGRLWLHDEAERDVDAAKQAFRRNPARELRRDGHAPLGARPGVRRGKVLAFGQVGVDKIRLCGIVRRDEAPLRHAQGKRPASAREVLRVHEDARARKR